MASGAYEVDKKYLKILKDKLIKKLDTREKIENFYKGKIDVVGAGLIDFDGEHFYSLSALVDYPEVLEHCSDTLAEKGITCIYDGMEVSFKDLLVSNGIEGWFSEDYDDWEVFCRENGINSDEVEAPYFKVKTGGREDTHTNIGSNNFFVQALTESNELVPTRAVIAWVDIDLTEAKPNQIAIKDFEIDGYTVSSFEGDLKVLMCDLNMIAPYVYGSIESGSNYNYENARFYVSFALDLDIRQLAEVSPLYRAGHKWCRITDKNNSTHEVLDVNVSGINAILEDTEVSHTDNIYKVYMKNGIPVLEDFAYPADLTIDDPSIMNGLVNEILKLNENIGTAYLLLKEHNLTGKMRIRKDTETNDFIVSIS